MERCQFCGGVNGHDLNCPRSEMDMLDLLAMVEAVMQSAQANNPAAFDEERKHKPLVLRLTTEDVKLLKEMHISLEGDNRQ